MYRRLSSLRINPIPSKLRAAATIRRLDSLRYVEVTLLVSHHRVPLLPRPNRDPEDHV